VAGNSQVDNFTIYQVYSIAEAFGLNPGDIISITGGGGKTSLMFALARALSTSGHRVISTTTTRILPPAREQSPCVLIEQDETSLMSKVKTKLDQYWHITLGGRLSDENKLKGLAPETIDRLANRKWADYIINEADGSAGKPIKAPNATEPVIPSSTTLVIAVAGMDALGSSLNCNNTFRPELISRLTGLSEGDTITETAIAKLMTHPNGIIQYSPPEAMIIPFLNKIDMVNPVQAISLAQAILGCHHPQIERVVLGALQKSGPFTIVTYKQEGNK
jgi:probable selenium-dependent hydroxylase accessory protein YqeC